MTIRDLPRATRLAISITCLLLCLPLLADEAQTKPAANAEAPKLVLHEGDHISIIGNTLADRMQHDGWLETLLFARFPKHNLTIRNLGFSGDELTLRLRSASFGTPDEWLTKCKTDVVFAFFGYNESFAGPAGLDKFKKDLEEFIKHTLAQKYNGKSAPRLVLFSPIAHENLKDRNLPDGTENNQRLEMYTKAMAEVAQAKQVMFVDLFKPSSRLHAHWHRPTTINGIHLDAHGSFMMARIMDVALFDPMAEASLAGTFQHLEKWPAEKIPHLQQLRQAVLDKNFHWFNRYRTTDGYSIFGGRADLKFVNNQTNRDVAQREMEVLDVMTANRDKVIWAVASGGRQPPGPDDSNTPPFIPVITNKPGAGPNGAHVFLDGDEAISKMTVAKNMKVSLFASEKQFPELAKPVQMAFDARGRLWVAVWPNYPHWKPTEEMNDKLLIFEDTDGDGRADKMTVFADKLTNPTGFEFWNGGVLIAQAPDLMFLKDTDGDDKADVRERVLHGLDTADTHHTSNSFVLDPGGALYFQEGTFHHSQVETPWGPPVRLANAGVFRYEPRTQKFDAYVSYPFANPHGHVFDRWGRDIVVDGTGAVPYDAALFSGRIEFPRKHATPPQVYQQLTRPCPGMEILSSKHFPDSMQGNLLVGNVIGYQGILQYRLNDQGASIAGTEEERILSSTDPNFRPSDLKVGPDGAIWFIDWHNPIIGHMQHNLRDPSRDRTHGRVYRITYEGRALSKSPALAGEPIEKLLALLNHPEDRVRYRARIELGGRKSDEVVAAASEWLAGLKSDDPNYEHDMLEGLWLHQAHNVVHAPLLERVLASRDHRARSAAARVLCYWRDRVPEALERFKQLAADSHPRVRLEAVRAASFFSVPEAVEIVLIAMEKPSDPYIDFVRQETMKTLDPLVKKALAENQPIKFTTLAGTRYFVKLVSTDDLLKMKRDHAVCTELLVRKGVRDEFRREALGELARLDRAAEQRVLLDAIRRLDGEQADDGVVFDLSRLLTARPHEELAGLRADLEGLALRAKSPATRQLGFVALIGADGKVEPAWELASKSAASLQDLVHAMPLIRDPNQRLELYPKVEALLTSLPKGLSTGAATSSIAGRYVRIELPGKQKTLTLAEVEVISGGKNVAPQGKASQKNTAHGGAAGRAIDGNKSGVYAEGGQTHSQEGTADPWWEVDLGSEQPIEEVRIYNRTEGNFGNRLNDFTLKVLDAKRRLAFERQKQPAPVGHGVYEVSKESPERVVRRAAMSALTSVRGKEGDAFKAIARFVSDPHERPAAMEALLRIAPTHWPKEEAQPLLDKLLAYIRQVPADQRTQPAVLDALQLADGIASLLPLNEAKRVRKELGELGIRMIRMGTIPDQMLFDKERIVVRAGKPVEILFENNDLMPHNLVVIQPGSLETIGNQAEAEATQPGALERHYVPRSGSVLFASRLLQPRESQRLAFTAPKQPGVYPIVCTYPGHWRRMHGAMYVVDDLDDYLADAEAYLAKHPLPIADELLKYNRPRKEWTFEELSAALAQLNEGRSYSNGKQIFQVASCIACHKFNGVGTELGPDLTKIDPKQQAPVEILRDLLEPSFRINEKYQTFVFELQSGKVLTALLLEETPDSYKVIENPLVKAETVFLKKADVAERKKSPNSTMPKGLLDKLTREEILDLIAYVYSKGDAKHKVYQGGGHHH